MTNILKILFLSLLIFLLLIPNIAFGSVNVEARKANAEKVGLFGDSQISATFQYGNTNLLNLGLSGLIGYKKRNHTILTFGSLSFTSEEPFNNNEQDIQNAEMLHFRYNYEIKKNIFWEVFTQVQADQNILIKFRYLVGTGPRAYFFKTDKMSLVYGASYMPEYEILSEDVLKPYPSNMSKRRTFVHRWNNYLSYRTDIKDQYIYQTTIYVQPRLGRFQDVKVFNDNVLTIKLTKLLDFTASVGLGYDREPPSVCDDSNKCGTINKFDLKTQLGVKIIW